MLRHRKQWSTGFTFFKRKSTIKGRKRARGKTIAKNIKGYFYKSWKSFSLSLSHDERRETKSPSNAIPGDVLKKLYGNKGKQLARKSEMEKSLSPHYLLTIHYWTRYTRFRIPIAKSFPRRYIHPSCRTLFHRKQTNGPYTATKPTFTRTRQFVYAHLYESSKQTGRRRGPRVYTPCLFRK